MKTSEEVQNIMDDWFNKLPIEIEESYNFLSESVKKFQTFDLLSYFAYYNHLHSSQKYTDYRGDKHFYVSEVIALLCLKNEFVDTTTISEEDYMELIIEMQKSVITYCGRNDAITFTKEKNDDTISNITNLLSRESRQIRNPGLPDHHLIFAEKLFDPIKNEVKALLGFSISDSVVIRKLVPDLINIKCQNAIDEAIKKANKYAIEIFKYRKTKTIGNEPKFTKEQFDEYSLLPDKQIKDGLKGYFLNELFYTFSKFFTLTANEIADFTNIELSSVQAFLNLFSCTFPSLQEDDKIYGSITILKAKPFIEHNGQYLIPSFPLLTWAVEEVIETTIRKSKKLNEKYTSLKHNFLLNQGLIYFKTLLPSASLIQSNLYYNLNNKRCETDGIIIYDKLLFIIEAKGNRITQKAKGGHELKTKDHLEDIIRDSYKQGVRTLKYLEENSTAEFETKNGSKIYIDRNEFNDIIIVSLTLEPIGSLTMSIKATNDIGYFNHGHFPWIVSIYDLIIFADLFDNPFMFIHYIKRRKNFLSHKQLSTYEELDLISYFLYNGLYIENTLKDAELKNANFINYPPDTDVINDYYMYKFGHKTKFTKKPGCYISKDFNEFLLQLDRSNIPHRVRIALLLLEFSNSTIKQLMDNVKKIKKLFSKDKQIHDCSIYSAANGGIGITYMIGRNKNELNNKLHQYCSYKLYQQKANVWIGLGDTSLNKNSYNFQSVYVSFKNEA